MHKKINDGMKIQYGVKSMLGKNPKITKYYAYTKNDNTEILLLHIENLILDDEQKIYLIPPRELTSESAIISIYTFKNNYNLREIPDEEIVMMKLRGEI